MGNKTLTIILLSFVLLLSACSPAAVVPSPGEPPTPLEASDPAAGDTQPLLVQNVDVVAGIGSPLPVDVVVSGTWPSLCSQIADIESSINEFQIDFTILGSMAASCPPDLVGLSFQLEIPLNIVEMEEGLYTITVNGVSTSFDMPGDLNKGTGAIFGQVWHDQCAAGLEGQPAPTGTPPGCVDEISPVGPYHANGILDTNEPPIEGVTVRLLKGDCAADSLTQIAETTTNASDGSYSFTELPPGSYCVYIGQQEDVNRLILLPGMWTYPTVSGRDITQTIFLEPTEGKYNVNFGWDYQLK